jgi:ABC-type amino acid transport substrate-binding protein
MVKQSAPRSRWRRGWRIGWLALCLLGPSQAGAGEFRVGVEDVDYTPIMGVVDGQFQGYAQELLELFARRSGHHFVYVPLPVRRLTPQLLDGSVDLNFPDNPNWRRELKLGHKLGYSEPFVPFQDVVFVRPAQLGQPLRSLGVVRGFTPKRFQLLVDAGQLHVTEAPAPANLVKMTLAGRIDGVALAAPVGAYQLRQVGQADGLDVDEALSGKAETHYRLSTLRHPELIAQFNDFLKAEAEAIQALQKRYGL